MQDEEWASRKMIGATFNGSDSGSILGSSAYDSDSRLSSNAFTGPERGIMASSQMQSTVQYVWLSEAHVVVARVQPDLPSF